MTRLHDLYTLGQSPWLDYIRKDLIENGELAQWVENGVRGVTSNPTLFENAIAKSDLYQAHIEQLAREGRNATEIYEALAFTDIKGAADVLLPVYQSADGADGFVSLEVPPALCDSHKETIAEGHRLWKAVDRPNLMIKVPATAEGVKAIRQLIADGVNVNVTLMFTMQDFHNVAEAYLSGLEDRAAKGQPLQTVASVASLFVSRVDASVETLTKGALHDELLGQVAIANVRHIYRAFQDVFSSPRFTALKAKGARVQRPLFASTGVKNKQLSDVLYVEQLIGSDSVNTMPPQTLTAFLDHGVATRTADSHAAEDEAILSLCSKNGIDIHQVGVDLKTKGLQSFADSFNSLMDVIETARQSTV